MKSIPSIAIAASLAALLASAPVMAQHRGHSRGGVHFGIGIGLPLYAYHPFYYPPYYSPYYRPYYPPVTVVPAAPPVYIERPDLNQDPAQPQPQYQQPVQPQAQANAGQNDWFYCADSKTYYPYVKQCAGEWQRVTPRPPER